MHSASRTLLMGANVLRLGLQFSSALRRAWHSRRRRVTHFVKMGLAKDLLYVSVSTNVCTNFVHCASDLNKIRYVDLATLFLGGDCEFRDKRPSEVCAFVTVVSAFLFLSVLSTFTVRCGWD